MSTVRIGCSGWSYEAGKAGSTRALASCAGASRDSPARGEPVSWRAEIEAVKPAALLALGALTMHPSAILLLRDHDEREEAFASFVADLRLVVRAGS